MAKLLGWEITIRRVHSDSDCPICIMETLREICLERIGDRYMPRHATHSPYGFKLADLCQLGEGCRCIRQGEALRGSFGP